MPAFIQEMQETAKSDLTHALLKIWTNQRFPPSWIMTGKWYSHFVGLHSHKPTMPFQDSVTHRYTCEIGKTLVHTQTCVPVCSAVVFN